MMTTPASPSRNTLDATAAAGNRSHLALHPSIIERREEIRRNAELEQEALEKARADNGILGLFGLWRRPRRKGDADCSC